jgi:hypothetical protein
MRFFAKTAGLTDIALLQIDFAKMRRKVET